MIGLIAVTAAGQAAAARLARAWPGETRVYDGPAVAALPRAWGECDALWEGRGYADVALSFISLTGPSVPAALERARRLGADRIVVAPYFLFAGVLPDRVTAQAGAFAEQHPGIDVRVTGLIGACDELAGLVLERYAEALHGDIRMNCDTCAYRIAMPGFADKVGQAQIPHHHPHDVAAGHHHP